MTVTPTLRIPAAWKSPGSMSSSKAIATELSDPINPSHLAYRSYHNSERRRVHSSSRRSSLIPVGRSPIFPVAGREFSGRSTSSFERQRQRSQSVKGELTHQHRDVARLGELSQDYRLRGVSTGQQIHLRLNSTEFDPILQVVNVRSGQIIAENDDRENWNSRLTFTVQRGERYQVRVLSYDNQSLGAYTLKMRQYQPSSIKDFSFAYGHGLVDASAAVNQAARRNNAWMEPESHPEGHETIWTLQHVQAAKAWKLSTGKNVTVAVLDTGVDYQHSALRSAIWKNSDEIPGNGRDDDRNGFVDDIHGWDFSASDADPFDETGHGTSVAGIIAARRSPLGGYGMAPDVKIMPVRVLGPQGGQHVDVAKGIRYAVKNGADVINMSLGAVPGSAVNRKLLQAIRFAYRHGVAVAIAAGNERQTYGSVEPGQPAASAGYQHQAVVVGAVDKNKKLADFSNPAGDRPSPFVVAPGVDIPVLVAGDRKTLRLRSGTSMATAYVSGILALMKSINPKLSVDDMLSIIVSTAKTRSLKVR